MFCLYGNSGCGKTSVARAFESLHVPECISHTTRKIRKGEVEGRDYYFSDMGIFNRETFIEHEIYCGQGYGLSLNEVLSKLMKGDGRCCVTVTERGFEKIRNYFWEHPEYEVYVLPVYIYGGSTENLAERMRNRGDDEEDIVKRIEQVKEDNYDNRHHMWVLDNSRNCDTKDDLGIYVEMFMLDTLDALCISV